MDCKLLLTLMMMDAARAIKAGVPIEHGTEMSDATMDLMVKNNNHHNLSAGKLAEKAQLNYYPDCSTKSIGNWTKNCKATLLEHKCTYWFRYRCCSFSLLGERKEFVLYELGGYACLLNNSSCYS
jgi:hypothetical protein